MHHPAAKETSDFIRLPRRREKEGHAGKTKGQSTELTKRAYRPSDLWRHRPAPHSRPKCRPKELKAAAASPPPARPSAARHRHHFRTPLSLIWRRRIKTTEDRTCSPSTPPPPPPASLTRPPYLSLSPLPRRLPTGRPLLSLSLSLFGTVTLSLLDLLPATLSLFPAHHFPHVG